MFEKSNKRIFFIFNILFILMLACIVAGITLVVLGSTLEIEDDRYMTFLICGAILILVPAIIRTGTLFYINKFRDIYNDNYDKAAEYYLSLNFIARGFYILMILFFGMSYGYSKLQQAIMDKKEQNNEELATK
ncbi:hypothetical protein ACM0IS_01965 [Mycoplasma aquilae ATCC BAA-1896]|uniref:hypothetical protein n=1 Tax=Mycoplasma aquilae TaxID=1312741 RepID=UPI003A85A6D7